MLFDAFAGLALLCVTIIVPIALLARTVRSRHRPCADLPALAIGTADAREIAAMLRSVAATELDDLRLAVTRYVSGSRVGYVTKVVEAS
jgi:hypothetical protein